MKVLIFVLLLFMSLSSFAATGIKGSVHTPKECSGPIMVWLSLNKDNYKERLLLMHTQVPKGGTFQFYLKKGYYQLRASDEKGCEYFKRIKIGDTVNFIKIMMEKK